MKLFFTLFSFSTFLFFPFLKPIEDISTSSKKESTEMLRASSGLKATSNKTKSSFHKYLPDQVYILPVVVHIINSDPSLFTDQQVQAAITDLNDAFAKTGNYTASQGADTKITFCLAQKDPDGGNTTGITRTKYFFGNDFNPDIENDKLKGLIQWPSAKYINIWYIVNMHHELSATYKCGVWNRLFEGGYATLPPNAGAFDGIVVTAFGTMLAHEMGHYLNLYHTFEGGCSNYNCSVTGDEVCDTPPEDLSNSTSTNCNFPSNSCQTDTLSGFTIDMPDQTANFMDYGNSACHNMFTQGQADRMRLAIVNLRSSLLENECDKPCADNSVASFTRDNAYPLAGDLVSFTNTSTNATNYQWLVNNIVVATTPNFSYTFTTVGKFKVTLKAFNADASCFAAYSDFIKVTCGVTARYYTDKNKIASKAGNALDSIVFTNTSVNATSYKWLMANSAGGMAEQVVSTNKNLTYVFLVPGNYTVKLIASNGSCSDTTETFSIPVADPTQDGVLYINNVYCYQQTKMQVSFYVCNNGYSTIPYGAPISFYDADPRFANAHKIGATFYLPASIEGLCCGYLYTQTLNIDPHNLTQLYVAFNDSGNILPLKFPNTPMVETSYTNNISSWSGNFVFKATALPSSATIAYGDTLKLTSYGNSVYAAYYNWFPAQNLSCNYCQSTNFIGDTTTTKGVVITTQYGCFDTVYSNIKVLPPNNFTIVLNSVACAANDNLQVDFTIKNVIPNGIMPKGLSVSFYNADPTIAGAALLAPLFVVPNIVNIDSAVFTTTIKSTGIGKTLYAVVNDNGTTIPLRFPTITNIHEKDYSNNIASIPYTRMKVTTKPTLATLEPGDTLQLSATAAPGNIVSYVWLPVAHLSCSNCDSTQFIAADYNEIEQVTATNNYGCTDTAFVVLKVPPANDYSVALNNVKCSANDSLYIDLSLFNSFKRGIIPQSLTVAFYDGDPVTGNAALLLPLFTVNNTVNSKSANFITHVKGASSGHIYAVVNDSGTTKPLQLPNIINLPEKDYTNNVADSVYQVLQIVLQPIDTTIMRKTSFTYKIATPLINPSSTVWDVSSRYNLNCYSCISPVITVFYKDTVRMQTANEFGCMLKGKAVVRILPADMTVKILNTLCYTNSTTQVSFQLCMNNNYDSVFTQVPVSFYDAQPLQGGSAKLLSPVFYTPMPLPGNCDTFTHIIKTPTTGKIYAVVNDKGDNVVIPNPGYPETNFANNVDNKPITPFKVSISPADTNVIFNQSATLSLTSTGSPIGSAIWSPSLFLSCTNCLSTVVTPVASTTRYMCVVESNLNCTDTVYAVVKTLPGWGINIPSAFTPNGDGQNDEFYVMGGKNLSLIKDFAIYDRWGKRVYYQTNILPNSPTNGWNGKVNGELAAAGTYIYQILVQFSDGSQQSLKGTVILVQ